MKKDHAGLDISAPAGLDISAPALPSRHSPFCQGVFGIQVPTALLLGIYRCQVLCRRSSPWVSWPLNNSSDIGDLLTSERWES